MFARPSTAYPFSGSDRAQHGVVHIEQDRPETALGKEWLHHSAFGFAPSTGCRNRSAADRGGTPKAQVLARALHSLRGLPIEYVSVRRVDEERNLVTRLFQAESFLDNGIYQI